MSFYVLDQNCKLILQFVDSLEEGLHIRPVVLPIPLTPCFDPIDMLVEYLPRGARVTIGLMLVGH